MKTYLYLTVFPEALVASMLPPEDFGPYLAVGSRKRAHGRAIFFEISRDLSGNYFDLSLIEKIAPHPDGTPKHSLTISIYRALEHVPLESLDSLFCTSLRGA